VNQGTGLEAALQSQASSSAQDKSEGIELARADRGERPTQVSEKDEQSEGEQRGSSDEDGGEQSTCADDNEIANEQASHWLKSILPEMTNGWWDVYPKGRGFAVKFCWRDPERQTLTFTRISFEQFQALKQSDPNEAEKSMHAQISVQLHNLALNPAKRDKALLVAQKLGINIDEYQITGVED
jgi:hypothetical protein